jgi:hypothetical protein
MRLAQVIKRETTAEIEVGEEKLAVRYDPAVLTPRFVQEMMAKEGEQDVAFVADMLSRVLKGWDLTDENGEQYPLTPDALMDLPLEFLFSVLSGVQDAMRPNPTKRERSGSFS